MSFNGLTTFGGYPHLAHVLAPVLGTIGVLAWRVRETRVPVSARSIVLPPLAMSTGFAMFVVPAVRIPWVWAAAAFLLGATVFALPLVRTSRLVRQGDVILFQRSRAVLAILLGLAAVRLALRNWIDHVISPEQTAALFFVLAFGMVLRWRAGVWREWRRLLPSDQPEL